MTSFINKITDYVSTNIGFKDDTRNLAKQRTAAAAFGAISLSASTYFLKNIITNSHGFPLGSIVGLGVGITYTIMAVSLIRDLNKQGAGVDWSAMCVQNQIRAAIEQHNEKKKKSDEPLAETNWSPMLVQIHNEEQ